jgi:uncharacterized membrane protein YhdT
MWKLVVVGFFVGAYLLGHKQGPSNFYDEEPPLAYKDAKWFYRLLAIGLTGGWGYCVYLLIVA